MSTFKKMNTYHFRVKRMKIFEFEPTGNTACLLSEDNGNVHGSTVIFGKHFFILVGVWKSNGV